jgi:hypothetical protein
LVAKETVDGMRGSGKLKKEKAHRKETLIRHYFFSSAASSESVAATAPPKPMPKLANGVIAGNAGTTDVAIVPTSHRIVPMTKPLATATTNFLLILGVLFHLRTFLCEAF